MCWVFDKLTIDNDRNNMTIFYQHVGIKEEHTARPALKLSTNIDNTVNKYIEIWDGKEGETDLKN